MRPRFRPKSDVTENMDVSSQGMDNLNNLEGNLNVGNYGQIYVYIIF
jgi:hypothetical protein